METLLIIFAIQGLLGAFDTIYHHELTERLPWKKSAAKELKLHGVRNFFYSIIFLSLGWLAWHGIFAILFALILFIEIIITLWDFVVEDKTRKLPATERITHTILALNYGCILALLAPVLIDWAKLPSGFAVMNFGVLSWVMTLYGIAVFGWAFRDYLRGVKLSKKIQKQPVYFNLENKNQNILVTGGTGFIGSTLCQHLINDGHNVTIITRNIASAAENFTGKVTLVDSIAKLNKTQHFNIIINLAGESINQRWSVKAKEKILNSRLTATNEIINFIKNAEVKPDVLISGSAIGFYGACDNSIFIESSNPVNNDIANFPKEICKKWEEVAKQAENYNVRTCLLRTGVVLGIEGGALAQMLFPFEFGLGGQIASGKQWFSWVHKEDIINLIIFIINNTNLNGAINATAPHPVINKVYSKALAKAMVRPAIIPLPKFQVKLLFGEMGDALLNSGQKVLPQKALDSGFKFKYSTIDEALENILQ